MKGKSKRAVALGLALTMAFTSVGVNPNAVAYAAGAGEDAQAVGEERYVLTWNEDKISSDYDDESYQIDVDENHLTMTTEYTTASTSHVNSISMPGVADYAVIDDGVLAELIGEDDATEDILEEYNYSYQWYEIGDDGNPKPLDGIGSDLYLYKNITNKNFLTTYRCIATLTRGNGNLVPDDTIDGDDYDFTLVYDRVYKYDGIKKNDFDNGEENLEDYFDLDIDDNVTSITDFMDADETIETTSMTEGKYPESFYLEYRKDGCKMDYTLTASYEDENIEDTDVAKDSDVYYFDSTSLPMSYKQDGNIVEKYTLHIDFKYGEQVIASAERQPSRFPQSS